MALLCPIQTGPQIVEALLKAGANVEVARFGQTPLQVAAAFGQAATVRALLQGGADPSEVALDPPKRGSFDFDQTLAAHQRSQKLKLNSSLIG